MDIIADCCGVSIARGPDDGGAIEYSCKDCDRPVCNKCAGFYEEDYDQVDGGFAWCGTIRCKRCTRAREIVRGMSAENIERNEDKIEAELDAEFGE